MEPIYNIADSPMERFKNLCLGSAIGATAGVALRKLGAGFWETGFGLSSLFIGIFVHGPQRNALKLAAPLALIGTAAKTAIKVTLSSASALPGKWIERIAGIGGFLPIAALEVWALFSSPQGQNLGPAIAGALGVVNTAGVDFGGSVEPGSLEGMVHSIFFSIIFDRIGHSYSQY